MALYIFLLSIGASFVQRTTGFGFGIFIMTMLPFFLPSYGEATALSGLLAMTTSLPIVWLLKKARLQKACQMLVDDVCSVNEVAFACGFSDPKYFSKCFKSAIGMTPTEYRLKK